jgi:rod shape-determining protein MreC
MENLLTRHRNLSVLAAVLFIQVFGLAVQVRSKDPEHPPLIRVWAVATVTPFEQAIVHAEGAVHGVWHNYLYLRGVRQENRDLKAQIEQLRLDQVRLNQDASQARRLQALLGFKEQSILATLPAQVVGSSGSEQSRSLYLDKGERDGLRKGMAVITADGVVGKVLQVYPHTAQVLLISDQ